MNIQNERVFNFEGALRGMRNPMNSWERSDSIFGVIPKHKYEALATGFINAMYTGQEIEVPELFAEKAIFNGCFDGDFYEYALIGQNDMDLAKKLIKAGTEHRKFLRQIMVSVDITAPLYVWKEFDTYKINVTSNSTSTMHKLATTPITLECFEIGDLAEMDMIIPIVGSEITLEQAKNAIIDICEGLRQKYLETKDKKYWKELVRWLPESWLQTRTITMNYENLRNIYHQRNRHKLSEWHEICHWIELLPYAKDFIIN